MKVSLCLEGLKKTFFFFFLRQNKVNLRTSTYVFHKSTASANINLQPSVLFYKNLRSAAGKFAYSAVSSNTYAPLLKHLI